MWPISLKYRQVIGGSHTVAQKVELLLNNEVILDLTNAGIMVDGTVTAAASSAVMRSGSCVLVDESGVLVPNQGTGTGRQLAPAGAELRLWRGIAYHDTDPELIPVATMRFTGNRVQGGQAMTLDLFDRAWAIAAAKTGKATSIAQGTNVVTAIRRLLAAAGGEWIPTNFPDTDETTVSMAVDMDSDPWQVCQELAANIGQRLFFDQMGVCTMTPEPDPAVDPLAWTLDEESPDNLALPGGEVNWEGTSPNAVVAVGENSDNTQVYRGAASDTDANSLTRYGGPYGRINAVIRDEKIASTAQANARARRDLNRNLGLITQPSTPILPNPALTPGDILLTPLPSQGFGIWGILDGYTLPLRASSPMTIDFRERHIRELGTEPV